jgi:ComF family protein
MTMRTNKAAHPFKHKLLEIGDSLLNLAWPDLCLLCGKSLIKGEKHLCLNCLYELPKTDDFSFHENAAADRFLGKISFEMATTGYHYYKESKVQTALELLKYKGDKEVGESLGEAAGNRLLSRGFFNDIDLLVPVPLHRQKEKKRGYNQSEWIARGLSKATGIPVDTSHLRRTLHNPTQTTKSIWQRWENVQRLFETNHPEAFAGKHILLIDDVLTSGSTLEACGQAILKSSESRISFFALALA